MSKFDLKESSPAGLKPGGAERVRAARLGFSLDWWSVIAALLLALLVRTNLLPAVPWDKAALPAAPALPHAR